LLRNKKYIVLQGFTMGITVISSISTASAANSSAQTATAPTDGTATCFAALLTGQIASATGLVTGLATQNDTTGGKGMDKSVDDRTLDTETTSQGTLDPALAYLIATPAQVQPVVTRLAAPLTSTTTGISASDAAGGSLSLQENLTESRLPQTKLSTNPLQGITEQQGNSGSALNSSDELDLAANIAANTQLSNTSGQDSAATLTASVLASQQKSAEQAHETTKIASPLTSANWSQSFSEKIVWLAKNDQQTAQININPPQLGPIQITLQINGDQASAVFASPHAEVRQAIENSLPQLKEMLSGAGINLGQANVGANLTQQNRETPFQSTNGTRLSSENAILPGIVDVTNTMLSTPIQHNRGLVDLFA
jgi:flagellar hook-length control protein FliK